MNDEAIKAFLKIMTEVDTDMQSEFLAKKAKVNELDKALKQAMQDLQDLVNQAGVLAKFRARFENKFLGEDSQEKVIHHPAQVE